MLKNRRGRSRLFVPLCTAALALLFRPALGEGPGEVDAPSGTVAFFALEHGGCPQGWRAADEASGRLLIGASGADAVGKLVGMPLDNQEDRTHQHAYTTTLDLPYKSISALDGGNHQGAAAQLYMDSGLSQPAASGLPFVQLLTCVKP